MSVKGKEGHSNKQSRNWDCDHAHIWWVYSTCGMGVAYHIALYSIKFMQAQHIFTTVTGLPAITGSFWTVTDREPGLSSKYGDVHLTLQVFSQRCEK